MLAEQLMLSHPVHIGCTFSLQMWVVTVWHIAESQCSGSCPVPHIVLKSGPFPVQFPLCVGRSSEVCVFIACHAMHGPMYVTFCSWDWFILS